MLSESNNLICLQKYIIKVLVEFFSNPTEMITSRYVLYFDNEDNIIKFDEQLRKVVSSQDEVDLLTAKLGDPNINISIMPDYIFLNDDGEREYEATQLKIANGSVERILVFIPDCDKDGFLLGDAFKNNIRNKFVDDKEDKILFYLSVQNIASVSKTTENFQRQGMPLSVSSVYNYLYSQVSIVSGENQQKVLYYSLDKIKSNKPQNDNSLLDFAPIMRIVDSQQLVPDDFHDLHMFSMGLTSLGKNNCNLAESHKLYRTISLALNDRELESVMSSYEPRIIKELEKSYEQDEVNWDKKFTLEGILKYKKANTKRFKLEQPTVILDRDNNELSKDYYIEFIKANSASFIIFTRDYVSEKNFKIQIKFTQKAVVVDVPDFAVQPITSRGNAYHIILNKSEAYYHGKVTFAGGTGAKKKEFTVYVSVMNAPSGFLANACVGMKEETSGWVYQMEARDYTLVLGDSGTEVEFKIEMRSKNSTPIPVNTSNITRFQFKHSDDEAVKDYLFDMNIDDQSAQIRSKVKFMEDNLRRLGLCELFNKCFVGHNVFSIDEDRIYNKNKHSERYQVSEFDVSGNKYKLNDIFLLEQQIIGSKSKACKTSGLKYTENCDVDVPADIRHIYDEICNYYLKLGTIPSLCYPNDDIITLYKEYISGILKHIGKDSIEFEDKKNLPSEVLNILKIGMVYDTDGLIWLSSLNPLSVAYQLELSRDNTRLVELDDYLYFSLGFGNCLPFIEDENGTVYQAIKGSFPIQWACFCNAAQSVKGEVSTYANKIQDYYSKFEYLFKNSANSKMIINVINIQHTSELINALLKLYKENSDMSQLAIEVNYYFNGTGKNDFDQMGDSSYVEKTAASYYGVKNVELIEGFCEWYTDKILYYAMPDHNEYKYAHISFCAMQGDSNRSLHNTISSAKSGVMLEGLISDVPSCLDRESGIYKYGYGSQYTEEILADSRFLQLADSLNELAKCKEGSTATRNLSIAQGVQNTKSEKLQRIYKASNWVVFVEPKIDLDFFINQSKDQEEDLIIIHYPDKNVSSAGYTSITVTQKSNQYIEVIRDILQRELPLFSDEMDIKRVICDFNAYSGEWLMHFINQKQLEEKISLVAAIDFCREYFKKSYSEYIWVPLALDEILRVTGSIGGTLTNVLFSKKVLVNRGIIENQNATSDDIMMAGIKIDGDEVCVTYIPVEVKHGKCGPDIKNHAHHQVYNTADLIEKSFLDESSEGKQNIDKKIYRNYMIQHVISNIEKMIAYEIVTEEEYQKLIDSKTRIQLLNDMYQLDLGIESDKYVFYFMEGTNTTDRQRNNNDGVIEIVTPLKNMYEFLINQSLVNSEVDTLIGNEMGVDLIDYEIKIPEDDAEEDADEADAGDKESRALSGRIEKLAEAAQELSGFPEADNVTIPDQNLKKEENQHMDSVRVQIGMDKAGNRIYWEFGNKQLSNRHLLITGMSGQGKTYSIQTMLFELNRLSVSSVIFDYTEGFMKKQLEDVFVEQLNERIKEHIVYSTGVPINPFIRHEIELGDTTVKEKSADVASRLADIFTHVYAFGEQQAAAVFSAALNGINAYGDNMDMKKFQMELEKVQETNKTAKSVLSKMEPFFQTVAFECQPDFDWGEILYGEKASINIFQLTLINREMQVIITELMLWDMWYYTKKYGSKEKSFVVVLDEAQNLSHKSGAPSAAILTEGRKFGWSAWFATQSLKVLRDDEVTRLSQAAFKLYFKPTADEMTKVAKLLDPTGEYNWLNDIKVLQKGQCIVAGDRQKADGSFGATIPIVVSVSSLESRL